jgi:hypothetical protein
LNPTTKSRSFAMVGTPAPPREGPPLSEEGYVASDVGFVIRHAVIRKPILGLFTTGSSRSGVDGQWCHSRLRRLLVWVARRVLRAGSPTRQYRDRGQVWPPVAGKRRGRKHIMLHGLARAMRPHWCKERGVWRKPKSDP